MRGAVRPDADSDAAAYNMAVMAARNHQPPTPRLATQPPWYA